MPAVTRFSLRRRLLSQLEGFGLNPGDWRLMPASPKDLAPLHERPHGNPIIENVIVRHRVHDEFRLRGQAEVDRQGVIRWLGLSVAEA